MESGSEGLQTEWGITEAGCKLRGLANRILYFCKVGVWTRFSSFLIELLVRLVAFHLCGLESVLVSCVCACVEGSFSLRGHFVKVDFDVGVILFIEGSFC